MNSIFSPFVPSSPLLALLLSLCVCSAPLHSVAAQEGNDALTAPGLVVAYRSGSAHHLALHDPAAGLQPVDMGGRDLDWISWEKLFHTAHGPSFFAQYTSPGSSTSHCGGFSIDRTSRRLVQFYKGGTGSMEFTTLRSPVADDTGRILFLGTNPQSDAMAKYIPYTSDGSLEGTEAIARADLGTEFVTLRTGGTVALLATDRGGDFRLYSADLQQRMFTRHLHGPLNKTPGFTLNTAAVDHVDGLPGIDSMPFFKGRATFEFGQGFATLLAGGKIAFSGGADTTAAAPGRPLVRSLPEGLRLDAKGTPVFANQRLFFSASMDGTNGDRALYSVETTGEVTRLPEAMDPKSLSAAGDRVFLVASKFPTVSDGTPAGTLRLWETEDYKWQALATRGGQAFFVSGREVLRSDGTPQGTSVAARFSGIDSFQLSRDGRSLLLIGKQGSGKSAQRGIWEIDAVGGYAKLVVSLNGADRVRFLEI